MNSERLLKLADLLEKDAKAKKGIKFDIGVWGFNKKKTKKLPVSCGTTACAVGLACLSGVFAAEGLTYKVARETYPGHGTGYFIDPVFGGERGFEAAANFFGLEERTTRKLFSPHYYNKGKGTKGAKGEREVALRIRHFVLFNSD